MSKLVLRVRNRYLLALDIVLLPLAAYLAFVLRLDSWDLGTYTHAALISMAMAVLIKIPIFALLGGYSRYWPFASLPELELLLLATALGELATLGAETGVTYFLGYTLMPRSIPLIELFLAGAALTGPRLTMRLIYSTSSRCGASTGRRVLIAGAGEGGNQVAQEIQRNPQLGLQPVGFVDDAPAKQGLSMRGVRVLGTIGEIPKLVRQYRIQQVLIAIPTATGEEMRRIVELCLQAGVEPLTLPGIFELISGNVTVQRFRPVQVEDLLARDPVHTDIAKVRELLAGKRVLVTGGGGSIGSELCRQIAACRPASLTIVGHGENSIYQIERALHEAHPTLDLTPVIADTRDAERIDHVFAIANPEIVLHAAAHKHVPLMELNPEEAVTNNIGGTRNLVRACERWSVETFVMISTDKAVNPTSTMGATKRIAELLVQEAAQRSSNAALPNAPLADPGVRERSVRKRFVAVRFGNVLGSRGSVVPLFQRQIEAGGPVTVTDPDMERFFMTIPEAVQLVLQAATIGQGGELFVLDMGAQVKIVDLARDMIRLAGLEEGRDIEIAFTGLRPGEKLYEELFLNDEHTTRTAHDKIFVSRNGHVTHDAALSTAVDDLLAAAHAHDRDELYRLIRRLVPECAETLGRGSRGARERRSRGAEAG
jgi:FlaA1/EpsC-like NDP-sugar epimerase